MSKENDDTDDKNEDSIGISAEVPVPMRDALFHLSRMTRQSASHHARQALLRYLTSPDIEAALAEAERFSHLTNAPPSGKSA